MSCPIEEIVDRLQKEVLNTSQGSKKALEINDFLTALKGMRLKDQTFSAVLPATPKKTVFDEGSKKETPIFDQLPRYVEGQETFTYAGIGSRETPAEVLELMTKTSSWLEDKGYTLNTGVTFRGKEEGADGAFSKGTTKKNLFGPEEYGTNPTSREIVKEIHPAPHNLKEGGMKLMARNTNQVFGKNLDTPVDFVLFYAEETSNPLRPKGGTGQAVEMARRKGIPTINMVDSNWREQLSEALKKARKQENPEVVDKTAKEDKNQKEVVDLPWHNDEELKAEEIDSKTTDKSKNEDKEVKDYTSPKPWEVTLEWYKDFARTLISHIQSNSKTPLKVITKGSRSKFLAVNMLKSTAKNSAYYDHKTHEILYPGYEEVLKDDNAIKNIIKYWESKGVTVTKEDIFNESKKLQNGYFGITTRVHENIHTGSTRFIVNNPNDSKTTYVNNLYHKMLKIAEKDKELDAIENGYWKQNVYEFIAVSLSDPAMMKKLSEMNASGYKNVFHKLVSTLAEMVGLRFDNEYGLLLDSLLKMAENELDSADKEKVSNSDSLATNEDASQSEEKDAPVFGSVVRVKPTLKSTNLDKDSYYVVYDVTSNNQLLLMDENGNKIVGAKNPSGFDVVKQLPVKEYNDQKVAKDKFGNLIGKKGRVYVAEGKQRDEVLKLFEENKPEQATEKEKINIKTKPVENAYELYPGVYTNEGQTNAINKAIEWFNSPASGNVKDSYFLLTGRGGTGKTTIVEKLLEMSGDDLDVRYTATSNSAALVLTKNLKGKQEATTIHKLLGFGEIGEGTGILKFFAKASKHEVAGEFKRLEAIVVDEVSMLASDGFNALNNVLALMKPADRPKVILMGDRAQMPPVNDKDAEGNIYRESVAFHELKGSKYSADLTQRMRQNETSPLPEFTDNFVAMVDLDYTSLAKNASNLLLDLASDANKSININEKGEGYAILPPDEEVVMPQLINMLVSDLVKNPASARFIGYNRLDSEYGKNITRKARKEFLKRVHNISLTDNNEKEFFEKEPVIFLKKSYGIDTVTEAPTEISTNEEAIVKSVTKKDMYIENSKTKAGVVMPMMEITVVSEFKSNPVKITTVDWGEFNKRKYTPEENKVIWYTDRFGNKVLSYAVENATVAIDYGYYINTHRAQGKTYDNVYIDADNILSASLTDDLVKMQSMYVATSRPRKGAYILYDTETRKAGSFAVNKVVNNDININKWKELNDIMIPSNVTCGVK